MSKKTSGHGGGHSRKHTSQHKHSGTRKHHPQHHRKPPHHKSPYAATPLTVKGVHTKHPKARGLALGEAVPCCAAEALAASLRLAGWPVGDEDVFALHEAAGGTAGRAVSILAVLEAASASGLAGVRPRWFGEHLPDQVPLPCGQLLWDVEVPDLGEVDDGFSQSPAVGEGLPHALIVGLELPGAHAVTVAPDGSWLSWGGHYDPAFWPEAALEETWLVGWPA